MPREQPQRSFPTKDAKLAPGRAWCGGRRSDAALTSATPTPPAPGERRSFVRVAKNHLISG